MDHRPYTATLILPQARAARRKRWVLVWLAVALVLIFVLAIGFGSVSIPLSEVAASILSRNDQGPASAIVHDLRLPRAITALLAGAALGVAGLQMQTLFRNPLADPFALGIAAGAGLGVALVLLTSGAAVTIVLSSSVGLAGDALVTVAAIAGAAVTLGIVLTLSGRVENPATVLILGLMFGYAASAFVTILVAGTDPDRLQKWISWGFGSFGGVTWEKLRIFFPLIAAGLVISLATTKQLNALLLGENYAASMGLNVKRMKWITMAGASILGGVVTAFCGPIAFVGVAVPHLCRGLLGTTDHRVLVPATVLMGGIVAILAQIVSLIPGTGVLPLNAVTALIGAPVVVAVLLQNRRGVFTG